MYKHLCMHTHALTQDIHIVCLCTLTHVITLTWYLIVLTHTHYSYLLHQHTTCISYTHTLLHLLHTLTANCIHSQTQTLPCFPPTHTHIHTHHMVSNTMHLLTNKLNRHLFPRGSSSMIQPLKCTTGHLLSNLAPSDGWHQTWTLGSQCPECTHWHFVSRMSSACSTPSA